MRGVYASGLQDRTQRKIRVRVTWEGCNAKMLRNVDLQLDLDLPEKANDQSGQVVLEVVMHHFAALRRQSTRHGQGSQEAAADLRPRRWGRGRSGREAAACAERCSSCAQERPGNPDPGGVSWYRSRRGTHRGSEGHARWLGVGAGFAGAFADGGTVVGQVGR